MRIVQKLVLFSIVLLLFVLSSCRYSKPLFCYFSKPKVTSEVDSISKHVTITKVWSFLSFKTGIHKGLFSITKEYNAYKKLLYKEKYRDTWAGCCDLPAMYYDKTIYFNSTGKLDSVKYNIKQGGYSHRTIYNKVVVYDTIENRITNIRMNADY